MLPGETQLVSSGKEAKTQAHGGTVRKDKKRGVGVRRRGHSFRVTMPQTALTGRSLCVLVSAVTSSMALNPCNPTSQLKETRASTISHLEIIG